MNIYLQSVNDTEPSNPTIGTFVVIITFMVMMWYIFEILISPIELSKRNRWYYYYAVPIIIFIAIYYFFIYLFHELYLKMEIEMPNVFYISLIVLVVPFWYFCCKDYYKCLKLKEELLIFRKQYPLRKVKE